MPIYKFRCYIITGTKECYSELHLLESIRIALGNTPSHEKQSSPSESEHPGDKPLNSRSIHATKDTSNADTKNDTDAETKRRKMP